MFKDLKMENYKEPTNIEEIRKFEHDIVLKLPNDYIEWLLKYNGGTPVIEDVFDLIEPYDDWNGNNAYGVDVHYFAALGLDNGNYISNLRRQMRWIEDRIPKDIYPIARTCCGDDICIGITGKRFGKVYFWHHEREVPDGKKPWYKNVYLVANSFTDFINKLRCRKHPLSDVFNGDIEHDSSIANRNMGIAKLPEPYTWHHVEDGKTMIAAPSDLHNIRHTSKLW